MNIETVPVQILVVGFGTLLAFIGVLIAVLAGLNLYILNKNANDVTKAEGKTTKLEVEMNNKLETKVDKSTNEIQFGQIIKGIEDLDDKLVKGIEDLDDKLIVIDSKLDSTIADLAFQKGVKQGEDNMRREYANK